MRSALRVVIFNATAIWLTSLVVTGLDYRRDLKTLLWASLALGLVNAVIKPLVKIVALPINFLTLGAFSWLISALMLYLVTLAVPGFTIKPFHFTGYNWQGFTVPAMSLTKFWATVAASLGVSTLANFFSWLCHK